MTVSKVLATHVTFTALGSYTVHVEGDRETVVERVADGFRDGVDLPIYVVKQDDKEVIYHKTWMFLGPDVLRSAMISDAHEINVTDEPWPTMRDDETRGEKREVKAPPGVLVVNLPSE